MRKNQKKKIVSLTIIIIVCLGLIIGLFFNQKNHPKQNNVEQKNSVVNNNLTIKDNVEENKTISNNEVVKEAPVSFKKSATFKIGDDQFEIQVTEHSTVYDAMNSLESEGKITFEGTEYSGLGFFVNQVGPLTNGNGKNLMYYINGEEASLGVSSYVLKEGDIIEWKLK